MTKIGIVTLNGYFNYGNRLQNYALQEVLKSINCEKVNTLVYNNDNSKVKLKFSDIKSKSILKKIMIYYYINLKEYLNRKTYRNRTEFFINFTKKYINEVDFQKCDIQEIESYDYIVAGSDQIWNPHYSKLNSFYFMNFVPRHKRVTYAASFGVSEIPDNLYENYQKHIAEIERLSVREESGQKLIQQLTGKSAKVHLDPTLLLTKAQWNEIAMPSKTKPTNPYVLTYFLGEKPDNIQNEILKFATENNCEIVDLGSIKDKKAYEAGPSEFIDYIKNCKIMFTDSFHGTVFSIIFEKPFIVYDRIGINNMFTRISTLLSKLGLEKRMKVNNDLNEDLLIVDYERCNCIIQNERENSLRYLKDSLIL